MPIEFNGPSGSIRDIHAQIASRKQQASTEKNRAAAELKSRPYGSLKNTWSAVKITLSQPRDAEHLATKFEKLSAKNRDRLITKAFTLYDRSGLDHQSVRDAEDLGYSLKSTPKLYTNQRIGLLRALSAKRHLMTPEQQYRLVEAAGSSSRSEFINQNLHAIGYND